jgi:hypothetical protein
MHGMMGCNGMMASDWHLFLTLFHSLHPLCFRSPLFLALVTPAAHFSSDWHLLHFLPLSSHSLPLSSTLFSLSIRYPVVPSAIARVQWWRVCLDEAQMVDSSTSQPAAMAARLPAVNRWCVTGTPFSRGVSDLHGLLFFLHAAPFSDRWLWEREMASPATHRASGNLEVLRYVLAPAATLWSSCSRERCPSNLLMCYALRCVLAPEVYCGLHAFLECMRGSYSGLA